MAYNSIQVSGVTQDTSARSLTLHIDGQKYTFIHSYRKSVQGYKNTKKIDDLKQYWGGRGFNLRVIDRGKTYDIYVARKKGGKDAKTNTGKGPSKKGGSGGIAIGSGVGKIKIF